MKKLTLLFCLLVAHLSGYTQSGLYISGGYSKLDILNEISGQVGYFRFVNSQKAYVFTGEFRNLTYTSDKVYSTQYLTGELKNDVTINSFGARAGRIYIMGNKEFNDNFYFYVGTGAAIFMNNVSNNYTANGKTITSGEFVMPNKTTFDFIGDILGGFNIRINDKVDVFAQTTAEMSYATIKEDGYFYSPFLRLNVGVRVSL